MGGSNRKVAKAGVDKKKTRPQNQKTKAEERIIKCSVPLISGMYTISDVKTAMIKKYGRSAKFALGQIESWGHKFAIETLYWRDYDGGNREALIDCDAKSVAEAAEWGMNALREWAGAGVQSNDYFYKITKKYAEFGVSNPNDAAVVVGEVLDWLYLFSEDSTGDSIYPEYEWDEEGTTDAADIFLYVFTGHKGWTAMALARILHEW